MIWGPGGTAIVLTEASSRAILAAPAAWPRLQVCAMCRPWQARYGSLSPAGFNPGTPAVVTSFETTEASELASDLASGLDAVGDCDEDGVEARTGLPEGAAIFGDCISRDGMLV